MGPAPGVVEPGASQILTFPQLQRIARPAGPRPTVATVIRWAERNHIRYGIDAAGGVFTTVDAVNAGLGLGAPPAHGKLEDLI